MRLISYVEKSGVPACGRQVKSEVQRLIFCIFLFSLGYFPPAAYLKNADGGKVSILDVPLKCEGIKKYNPDDLEKTEYLVRIQWIKTIPEEKAFWVKGMRANQNSAFKLKSEYTLKKLLEFFGLEE